jgi:hypothetical protein
MSDRTAVRFGQVIKLLIAAGRVNAMALEPDAQAKDGLHFACASGSELFQVEDENLRGLLAGEDKAVFFLQRRAISRL